MTCWWRSVAATRRASAEARATLRTSAYSSATSPQGHPAAKRWLCLELHVAISQTQGSARLYLDEAPLIDFGPDRDTHAPEGFGLIRVGIGSLGSGSTGPLEVVVDDIVLSRAPVGCR